MRTSYAIIAAILLIAPATQAEVPSTDAIRRALTSTIQTRRFQTELPGQVQNVEQPRQMKKIEPWKPPEKREAEPAWEGILPDYFPPILKLLFWLLVFAAVAYLALPMISEMTFQIKRGTTGRPEAARGGHDKSDKGDDDIPLDPVAAARMLAAKGRAADAIHMLLMAAVRRIETVGRIRGIPALTNREISRNVLRDRNGSQAFARLVTLGERIRFAGHEAREEDVAQSCESYLVFTAAMTEVRHG